MKNPFYLKIVRVLCEKCLNTKQSIGVFERGVGFIGNYGAYCVCGNRKKVPTDLGERIIKGVFISENQLELSL